MANKLKIYACSGIGDVVPKSSDMYNYWTDNTNTLTNTQAVNNLLSQINLLISEIEHLRLNDGEVLNRLDDIDVLVVCLDAAQNYSQHYTQLEKAGRVIGTMQVQNQFVCDSLDNDTRDKHLDELITWFEDAMQEDGQYVLASAQFLNWWNINVVMLNKVGLSAKQRSAIQATLSSSTISGVGDSNWQNNKEISNYLSNGGTYFLYTYFTDAQLKKLPFENRKIITVKREEQRRTYNYCKSLFVGIYGTESAMQDIIRTGCVAKFGEQPEDVCEDLVSGKRTIESVGVLATSVIVAIIGGIVSIVVALITKICETVAKSNAAKYAAVTKEEIEASVPNPEDYEGYDLGTRSLKAGMNYLPLMAIALGILIFGRNF